MGKRKKITKNPNTNLPNWEEYQRKQKKVKRKGKQAKRKASRSPGGFAGGGAIETYSAQVQRKYGGGKV